jgi:hypothetical protein
LHHVVLCCISDDFRCATQESIEFAHPVTGDKVYLSVPPPAALLAFLQRVALRLPR